SLDKSIKDDLEGLDKNTMYLTKYSFGPTTVPRWQRDNYPQVEYPDYEFIKRNVPEINSCAYVIFGNSQSVRYQDRTLASVQVTPVSNEIYDIDNLKMSDGRFYTEVESVTGSPVVVLGYSLAENLFDTEAPVGKVVRIFGRKLTVIGVLKKYGSS